MKWLLTGGSGFTGKYISKTIINEKPDDSIYICDLLSPKFTLSKQIIFKRVNLLDTVALKPILKEIRPDYIIHLAATFNDSNPLTLIKLNIEVCCNLFEIIKNENILLSGFLVIGSSAQYGKVNPTEIPDESSLLNPSNLYGHSKVIQEVTALEYYRKHNIPVVCVRPANIIGPGMSSAFVIQKVINQLIEQEKHGNTKKSITINNIHFSRDFIDVRDVSKAYIDLLLDNKTKGQIFNIGSGKSIPFEDIMEIIKEKIGVRELKIQEESPKENLDFHLTKSDKIKDFIGWTPKISLEETISNIIEYTRSM